MIPSFDDAFHALTRNRPFPWQRCLYERFAAGDIPAACEIPTGLGKTSVIAVWLLARRDGAKLPRRLVYVVNRRTVVDQTTEEIERLLPRLSDVGIEPLAVSTLRGQRADNRAWSENPSRHAVVSGTVDMIGSRLLFGGYRIGYKTRPLHAGFLGQDALLVHDEAHLEPAFQALLETIVAEQQRADLLPLKVMALTATTRSASGALRLSDEDRRDAVVQRRIRARKSLVLDEHGDKNVVDLVVERVLRFRERARAVLVFLRTVDDVAAATAKLVRAGVRTQQLTGTMRGYERDGLVREDAVFRRFLTEPHATAADMAVLVCTSAGEVGVNLSADDLVCDLSTFDAMAQRFGRLNRFGVRDDSEVHVLHPSAAALEEEATPLASARAATLRLLHALNGDASPDALAHLDPELRAAAFAPSPALLPASDILFDAWAMTTIRERLPGRPPLAPFLHGVAPWEPPSTQVAWREEVTRVRGADLDRYPPRELLEDFPLKPLEILADRTKRVVDTLMKVASDPVAAKLPIWRVDDAGAVAATTIGELMDDERARIEERLAGCTLLLPAPTESRRCASWPINGTLSVDGFSKATSEHGEFSSAPDGAVDVSCQWTAADDGQPSRHRTMDGRTPNGMRLVRTVLLEGEDADADEPSVLRWSWFERPHGADDEGSRTAPRAVLLDVHSQDVESHARAIVDRLSLPSSLTRAVVTAARLHDIGKRRVLFQRSLGNHNSMRIYAKASAAMRPAEITKYRHELGSVLDARRGALLEGLDAEERELVLHLIGAHHGRARPHFPEDELFDPDVRGVDMQAENMEVARRFADLQRRYGRWGLAYLESLVRAADYAASAEPSKYEDDVTT